VATPIDWDELANREINSKSYNLKNIFRRLAQKKDPWNGILEEKQSFRQARNKLNDLIAKTGLQDG